MALTYTPALTPTSKLPEFTLPTVEGLSWSSQSVQDAPAKVFVFMCNHCPYVKAIESRLIALALELKEIHVPFVGICSNDPTDYPEDQPDQLYKSWKTKNYGFPYLIDSEQNVARSFGAVCTPDIFVYDKNNSLAYRGRLDDSWKDASRVSRRELKDAVVKIVRGESLLAHEQTPSMGCSIKWKT